ARRNLLEELGIVAATFASHPCVVGHDIGCIAHGPLIGPTYWADIAGSAASIFADLTEPAVCPRSCKRLRQDHGCADAALWLDARLRGSPEDLCLPGVRADRPNHYLSRLSSIVVETHRHLAEILGIHVPGAPQATLLPHREEKRQRRMIRRLPQQLSRKCYEHGTSS